MPDPKIMVNLAETRLPEAEKRAAAQGVAEPAVETAIINGSQLNKCPSCGGWRPEICIVLTVNGWGCDGCVSAARRQGTFQEWESE